jgi:hypothetical protein
MKCSFDWTRPRFDQSRSFFLLFFQCQACVQNVQRKPPSIRFPLRRHLIHDKNASTCFRHSTGSSNTQLCPVPGTKTTGQPFPASAASRPISDAAATRSPSPPRSRVGHCTRRASWRVWKGSSGSVLWLCVTMERMASALCVR